VVLDKYHATEIGKIPHATEQQMDDAIVSAKDAFEVTRK